MASLSGVFNLQAFTDAGALAAGYRLYTYAPSTTTQKVAYTDAAGLVPHTYTSDGLGGQYIALNARGELAAPLFLSTGGYDITLKTAAGVTVWTRRAISVADEAGDASEVVDAVLRSDLSNTTDAAKGGAMVGYGETVEYPRNTVAGELRTYQSQTAHFWSRLRSNQSNVNVLVIGDSTGNAVDEWVYLMTQWLASECPTHTVKYRLFGGGATVGSGGTLTWGSYTTLQTGTGYRAGSTSTSTTSVLNIDNFSIGGTNTNYAEGVNESVCWGSTDYDLVIFNYGHNTGTDTTEEIAQPEFMTAVCNARLHAPRAGILVTLQNPRTSASGSAQTARMANTWRNVASQLACGVIDVYTAFRNLPDAAPYMGDETHPNALGMSDVWLPQVKRAMAEPLTYTGEDPGSVSPFAIVRPSYLANPRFSDWASTNPSGWTFANVTPAKDPGRTEGSLYSMRLTNTGASPQVTQDISGQLPRLRGRVVTMVARIWRTSGLNLIAGRIGITANNGAASSSVTSYPRSLESAGGWEWAQISLMVPSDAVSLTVVLYAGAADASDNGEQMWVDSIGLFESSQPGAVPFDDLGDKLLLDFYSDGSVGLVPSTTVGSVTAVGGVITLTGAVSPNSGVYINLPGLTAGKTYKASFRPVSAVGGIMAGGVYARNGYGGGSTDIAKASGTGDWVAGGGTVTFTFVAPANAVSLWAYGYTDITAWVMDQWSIKPVESGIAVPVNLSLFDARTDAGLVLTGTAPAGGFSISNTPGTATRLIGENAQGNTKTDAGTWEVALPADYVAGRDITVTINAAAVGLGTLGATKTLTLFAYLTSDTAGTHGSNLGPAAQTLTNAYADYAFTVAGTTLSPGKRIQLRAVTAIQETGGANAINGHINSVRIS